MRAVVVGLLLLAAGCFSPHYDAPLCADDGSCPDGLRCGSDGVCGGVTGVDAAEVDSSDDGDAASVDAGDDAGDDARPDACVPGPELCNGADDNCNGTIDEGFPTLGTACDGPDTDVCTDDVMVCAGSGGSTTCGTGDDDLEVCNGADDDCDAATDEGINVGMPCDGTDGDACLEGTLECDPGTGGIRCSDTTGTLIELCNNADDDCDVAIDEGFDLSSDAFNCGLCGRECSNGFGTTTCASSACEPTCSAGANDCDGNPVTGCELRNTNPTCAAATALGAGFVAGDTGAGTLTGSGYGEAVYTVQVRESAATVNSAVRAQVTLSSPAGINFDLDVTCVSCGGTTLSSNSTGATDVVAVRRDDRGGQSDTFDIIIAVRWTSSTACGSWTLTVAGNAGTTATQTCPP